MGVDSANKELGEWRERADCRGVDPDLFFPNGNTGRLADQVNRAKEVCGQCAVRQECLEFAIRTNEDSGIWGGATEEERRTMRKNYILRSSNAI